MELLSLLVELEGLSDVEAEELGIRLYRSCYIPPGRPAGTIAAHDGLPVVFHDRQYGHAFRTDRSHGRDSFAKDVVARERIERVRWIGPIIRGEIANTECWECMNDRRNFSPAKRLYLAHDFKYVIWLNPRKDEGFTFISAYLARSEDIKRYRAEGRRPLRLPLP